MQAASSAVKHRPGAWEAPSTAVSQPSCSNFLDSLPTQAAHPADIEDAIHSLEDLNIPSNSHYLHETFTFSACPELTRSASSQARSTSRNTNLYLSYTPVSLQNVSVSSASYYGLLPAIQRSAVAQAIQRRVDQGEFLVQASLCC